MQHDKSAADPGRIFRIPPQDETGMPEQMRSLYILAVAVTCVAQSPAQVTTAFTYQGELEQAGSPASGEFDFEFTLFDASSGGLLVAGPVAVEDVFVDGGLFGTEVDFGMDVYGITDVWLEVRVREGDSTGGFTTLSPRQKITPAPLALHAQNVEMDAVDTAQIAPQAVTGNEIADGSVGAGDIDPAQVQRRITGTCDPGDFVTDVQADGTVVCVGETGDIGGVTAGSGLTGGANSGEAVLAADFSAVQARLTEACGSGEALASIDANGDPVCRRLPVVQSTLTLDTGNGNEVGYYSSLAIGTDGLPVVGYFDFDATALKVAHCDDAACTGDGESVVTVDSGGSGDVGTQTSLAIGSDGFPVISHMDFSAGSLKITHCNDVACAGGDEDGNIVDAGSGNIVGRATSIAIGSDGFPIISYHDDTAEALKVAHCNDLSCAGGDETISTVDDGGGNNVGVIRTSIAIGSDGMPVISYYDDTDESLKVAHCNDLSCSGGNENITVVDDGAGNNVGVFSSLAISSDGLPIISYTDSTDLSLKVAKCMDVDCASATISVVDDGGAVDTGLHPVIAIGSNDLPVIAYREDLSDSRLMVAHCNDMACTGGDEFVTVVDDGSGNSVGWDTSIAIGDDGLPVISYRDTSTDALKITRCATPTCG